VVLTDSVKAQSDSLRGKDVLFVPLSTDRSILQYPLAIKAFAAARVEELVKNDADTLIWFDPGVIVLNSIEALDLLGKYDVAVRPVTLSNTIGIPPDVEPNEYWAPIYGETGVVQGALRTVKTLVDELEIRPYFNCEVFSVNPKTGICAAWAQILERRLRDGSYQERSCTTFLRRLFLHQAVLSGVITSRVNAEKTKPLPVACGYPFNQHDRLPAPKRISALNEAAVVIFDQAWNENPGWLDQIKVEDPLRTWLRDTHREFLGSGD